MGEINEKLVGIIMNNTALFECLEQFCGDNNIKVQGVTVAQILESMDNDQRIRFSEEIKKVKV